MRPETESRLADLRKSISEMSDEELYAHIGASRNNRRTPTPPKKAKAKSPPKSGRKSRSTQATPEAQLIAKLNAMSDEERQALLEKLTQG